MQPAKMRDSMTNKAELLEGDTQWGKPILSSCKPILGSKDCLPKRKQSAAGPPRGALSSGCPCADDSVKTSVCQLMRRQSWVAAVQMELARSLELWPSESEGESMFHSSQSTAGTLVPVCPSTPLAIPYFVAAPCRGVCRVWDLQPHSHAHGCCTGASAAPASCFGAARSWGASVYCSTSGGCSIAGSGCCRCCCSGIWLARPSSPPSLFHRSCKAQQVAD